MDTMAPLRPTFQRPLRVSLTAAPAAAAEARNLVRATICAWEIPVDPFVAALLTSELVTNAIANEAGQTIMLVVTRACDQLRVDVHDTSWFAPELAEAPVDAEAGRGLMLVDSMSADWGFYRTVAGKAVYFTLSFDGAEPHDGAGRSTPGDRRYVR